MNILFLHPGPIYRPDLPDIRDKYALLSKEYSGVIISQTADNKFKNYIIDKFCFSGVILNHYGLLYKIVLGTKMFFRSIFLHYSKKKFNLIVAYDPIFTGAMGAVLKTIFRTKLIIEVNGDILQASSLGRVSIVKKIKMVIYKIIMKTTLKNADKIKLLYEAQKIPIKDIFKKNKTVFFTDFTPTHIFSPVLANSIESQKKSNQYLLFVGYPFYLKGVDTLIKSFLNLTREFPNFRLKLIGHKLEQDAHEYFNFLLDPRIVFQKAVAYDEISNEFLNSYCFVLASRSEGMPRVIVEAMASGKPIIASRVGGIPELIKDGKNGFLFENGDIEGLTSKLRTIMSNPELAILMGKHSLKLATEKFSSERYYENFSKMVNSLL